MPSRLLLDSDRLAAEQLIRHVQDTGPGHGVVAFLGSGLSTILGYPDWHTVVREIASKAGRLTAFEKALADANRFPDIAEECRQSMFSQGREAEYYAELERQFPVKAPRPQGDLSFRGIHTDILRCDFSAFLTTNYDLSIDHAANCHKREALLGDVSVCRTRALDRRLLSGVSRQVYYLHGTVFDTYGRRQPWEAVVTRSDYDRAYDKDTGPVYEFLREAFLRYTVLFVGCGFEPDIKQVLQQFRKWGEESGGDRIHFALCPVFDTTEGEDEQTGKSKPVAKDWDYLHECGVNPLRYRVVEADDAHDTLGHFFQLLSQAEYCTYRRTRHVDQEGVPV